MSALERTTELGPRLFALVSDGAFIDVHGTIAAANLAGARLYGCDDPDELVGRRSVTLVPDEFHELLMGRPDRLADNAETDRWAVEEILRLDGSRRRVEARSTPITWEGKRAALVLLRSLPDDEREASSILRAHAAALRVFGSVSMSLAQANEAELDATIVSVLQEIAEAAEVDRSYIIQFSSDGESLSCTHEWCREGIARQQDFVQDFRFDDFTWSHGILARNERVHAPTIANLPAEAKAEKESFGLYDVRSMLSVPMMVDGRLRGCLGFNAVHRQAVWPEAVIDQVAAVADAIATALTRRDAARVVARARDEAERANELKDRFLARISHELRTPLSAVLGFTELLLLEEEEEHRRRLLEEVQSSGHHLLSLVDDALDVTQLTSGELGLERSPVVVSSGVAVAVAALQFLAEERGVEIIAEQPLPETVTVEGDPSRLVQVLRQLIENAILFNREGGTVTVSQTVSPGADRDEGKPSVHLVIADTGIGMAPDQLDRAFEPFDRLGAESTSTPGAGLGLSLSRLLIERMGGHLDIASEVGVGTEVTITFSTR